MSEYTINKIEYDGNIYNLQDANAGTGTVTSIGLSNATNGGLTISGSPITSSGTISIGHSNVLAAAQTTQAVYPITIDKNGHISAYGTAVTIPDISGKVNITETNDDIVTNITRVVDGLDIITEGYIDDYDGMSSITITPGKIFLNSEADSSGYPVIVLDKYEQEITFMNGTFCYQPIEDDYFYEFHGSIHSNTSLTLPNRDGTIALTSDILQSDWNQTTSTAKDYIKNKPTIPTKVSDLTNDSGFITTDTNTTYTLTNALSSHKFTWTLTAGGSGSGSTTTTAELVAGTGITLTDDTTNKKITIASSVTNTDTKLQVAEITSGTTYYPIVGTGTTAATRQYDTTGLVYIGTNGTTSAVGSAKLTLGNSTASGTANNKQGQLVLYGSTAYAHTIQGAPTAARTLTLPDKTGTIALTSDIPANEIFVAEYDVTSYNDILSAYIDGKTIIAKYPDEDFITDADFYYLIEANVSDVSEFAFVNSYGQYVSTIIINDSDEWSESGFFIPSITLNGSGAQYPSFYAPTSAGTSGYVLTSNGSGAPSWSNPTAAQIVRWVEST